MLYKIYDGDVNKSRNFRLTDEQKRDYFVENFERKLQNIFYDLGKAGATIINIDFKAIFTLLWKIGETIFDFATDI